MARWMFVVVALAPAFEACDAASPGWVVVRVSDPTGAPVPARIVVRGVGGTADPNLGPPGSARGARQAIHTITGRAEISLPAGSYHLVAGHGPEWTMAVLEVTVEPGRYEGVGAVIEQAVLTPQLVGCDLHVHASPSSDSPTPLEDRVASLVAEGIDFFAASDHNAATDYDPVIDAMGLHDRLRPLMGVEITPPRGLIGHFNVFPLAHAEPFETEAASAAALLSDVRRREPESLVQVNHPWSEGSGSFRLHELDETSGRARAGFGADFDLVEVWNGKRFGNGDFLDEELQRWIDLLGTELAAVGTGNSDSHGLADWIGLPRTMVRVGDESSPADVVESLRAGRVFVTSGPILDLRVEGGRPGDVVGPVDGSVTIDLRVDAASWVDLDRARIWVGASPSRTLVLEPELLGTAARAHVMVEAPVSRDSFVVVAVDGDSPNRDMAPGDYVGPRAFTNPVWIDADGDGRILLPRETE